MCDDPNDDNDKMPKKLRFDGTKLCIKCKARRGNTVVRHAVYCKPCLDDLVITKFRRAIHQSLNLASQSQYSFPEPTKNVLVHVTAGVNSAVLLDLVEKECFPSSGSQALPASAAVATTEIVPEKKGRKRVNKREQLWKAPVYAYVELCAAYPGRPDHSEEVEARIQRSYPGRRVVVIRIEDAFDPDWWSSLSNSSNPGTTRTTHSSSTPKDRLLAFVASLPTPSAKSTLISHLTRLLLLHTARSSSLTRSSYSCSHILMGDSLSSIAVGLIASVAEGGGFNLGAEWEERWRIAAGVGSNDALNVKASGGGGGDEEVMILKPLRDVTAKECGVFFRWRGLDVLVPNGAYKGEEDVDQGIRKLTRDFIVGLDKDFPSTVNAIVRTIGKVSPKTDLPLGRCRLCQSSPSADALVKLAGSLSSARRVSSLWCILPIFKWLSAIERSPNGGSPLSRTLQRVQALSMLAFYSLELVSFFSSPTAPLIPTSIISPQASGRAQLWSIRAWALYTIIQVGLLVQRSRALSVEENTLKATLYSGEKDAEEVKVQLRDVRKRKAASRLALIENSAFLPLTFHWSFGGLISNPLIVDGLSFVAAIAGFKAGWDNI